MNTTSIFISILIIFIFEFVLLFFWLVIEKHFNERSELKFCYATRVTL